MKIILVVLVAFMLLNYSCGKKIKENFSKKRKSKRLAEKKKLKKGRLENEVLLNKVLNEKCDLDVKRGFTRKGCLINLKKNNKKYNKKYNKLSINKKIKDFCNYSSTDCDKLNKFKKIKNYKKLCENHLNIFNAMSCKYNY